MYECVQCAHIAHTSGAKIELPVENIFVCLLLVVFLYFHFVFFLFFLFCICISGFLLSFSHCILCVSAFDSFANNKYISKNSYDVFFPTHNDKKTNETNEDDDVNEKIIIGNLCVCASFDLLGFSLFQYFSGARVYAVK